MRISDWSSDVCSSDLRFLTSKAPACNHQLGAERSRDKRGAPHAAAQHKGAAARRALFFRLPPVPPYDVIRPDARSDRSLLSREQSLCEIVWQVRLNYLFTWRRRSAIRLRRYAGAGRRNSRQGLATMALRAGSLADTYALDRKSTRLESRPKC